MFRSSGRREEQVQESPHHIPAPAPDGPVEPGCWFRPGVRASVEALPAVDVPAGQLGPGRRPRRASSVPAGGEPTDHLLPPLVLLLILLWHRDEELLDRRTRADAHLVLQR